MKQLLSAIAKIRKINLCSATLLSIISTFPPAFASENDPEEQVETVDTFSSEDPSRKNLPSGWHPSRKDISMFSLQQENGEQFLRVKTEGGCTSIGKQHNFSLDLYPLLSWKWRVHKLPTDGDESQRKKNDSGAGIYVFFKGSFKLNNIIKYVWSSTLAAGTTTSSPYNKRAHIVVLRSGTEKAGIWISETVNIQEDYRRLFGKNPPEVEGIGLLSDADNTGSEAMADYDDIRISKNENLAGKMVYEK